jgi:hypothetical protein
MDFAADLPIFYADFGQPVTLHRALGGTVVGRAIFDLPSTMLTGGEVLATDYSLRYPAAMFANVLRGDVFAVAGVNYTVREAPQFSSFDGIEVIVPLAKP